MKEQIIQELQKLEQEQEIKIVYACESGSRAWGFPSPDSDYDVRFIYMQSPKRYLSIYDKKDAIDLFLAKDLDLIGWDIRKSLRLFHKSNASPYEWMQSPIVYEQKFGFVESLQSLAGQYFSLRAGLHHYLGIVKHTYLGHLKGEQVKLKKYFYALRPLFCARWIVERQSYPPIEFNKLFPVVDHHRDLMENIEALLKRKEITLENELVRPIPFFQEYIVQEWKKLEEYSDAFEKPKADVEPLNELFRTLLNHS
jgi:uncharacterized protein